MTRSNIIPFHRTFAMTWAGFIVPMITGLVSATSSALILYVIFKSDIKLSSTYHRIMALMSCFDIISSTFIALGTIMMPSDNIYPFAGPMLGNKVTCQIQAWLVAFGVGGAKATNSCLAVYFVLKIVFKIKSSSMKRYYVEPIMFLFIFIAAFFPPCLYLSYNFLNPSHADSFCILAPYPDRCEASYTLDSCEWITSDFEQYRKIVNFATGVIGCHFSIILLGMTFILLSIHSDKNEMKRLMSFGDQENESRNQEEVLELDVGDVNDGGSMGDNSISREQDFVLNREIVKPSKSKLKRLKYTRVLTIQALMYIGAFFLTWFLYIFAAISNSINTYLMAMRTFLFPLQGLWNFFIFLYDKAYILRQDDDTDITFWEAAKRIMKSPSNAPGMVLVNMQSLSHHDVDGPSSIVLQDNCKNHHPSDPINSSNIHIQDKSDSSAATSPYKLYHLQHRSLEFLGTCNRRYFQSASGRIRRTGEIEDKREGRVDFDAAVSIDSPVGFLGESVNSASSNDL